MSRGRIQEPPKSTLRPRFEKISVKRARSDATTRSQPSARLQPAPAATPLTAAIVGIGQLVQPQRGTTDDPHLAQRSADAGREALGVVGVGEVRAGAEPVAGAGDHEHAGVGVVLDLVEHLDQLAPHLPVDGVLLLGSVAA